MNDIIDHERIAEIKKRIPEMFYHALLGELISVFGIGFYHSYSDDGEIIYDFDSGTAGWTAALYMTCKKLDMMWLFEAWHSMAWYDSDTLDGEIEEELARVVKLRHSANANDYYLHALSEMNSDPLTNKKG